MNGFIRNLTIKNKFLLLISMVLFGFLLVASSSVYFLRESIIKEKELKTQQIVEAASGILDYYHDLAKSGKLSETTAKSEALAAISMLRYDKKEYFWINDLNCRMVMHPIKPELNGQDLSEFKDPTGKRVFYEFTETVKKNGAGFVRYMWTKGNQSTPVEKLSFVRMFEPWGWVIGTGIYIDDVNGVIWQKLMKQISFMILIMAVVMALSWCVARNITFPVKLLSADAKRIAAGDLSMEVNYQSRDEIGQLAESFHQMIINLRELIGKISLSSEMVASSATQLSSASTQIATGSEEVAAQAGSIAAASEEMAATSMEIAKNCGVAADESKSANDTARDGASIVDGTISSMQHIAEKVKDSAHTVERLGNKSDQIGEIIGTIEDIADQTNLLALNAAIEAARAGEHGRGFAVVADEVRALAERTTKATKEIDAMIRAIQRETKEAVGAMEERVKEVGTGCTEAAKSGNALREIQNRISAVTMQVNQMATAVEQQTATTGEISGNIQQITQVIQMTAKEAQESAVSAEQLARLAEELQQLTGQFKLAV